LAGFCGLQTYPGLQPKVRSESTARGAVTPVGAGQSVTSKMGVTVMTSPGTVTVDGGIVCVVVVVVVLPGSVVVIVVPSSVMVTVSPGVSTMMVEIMVWPGRVVTSPGRVMVDPGSVTVGPGAVTVGPGAVTVGPGTVVGIVVGTVVNDTTGTLLMMVSTVVSVAVVMLVEMMVVPDVIYTGYDVVKVVVVVSVVDSQMVVGHV
jgi:hypothetical protein